MLFYRCNACGNFVTFLGEKTACTPKCCGMDMEEMVANTTDAAREKHVPVVTIDGNAVDVRVGSVDHPMTEAHLIQWIILETSEGYHKKDLKAGQSPSADFRLTEGEKALAVYAYCNLHGLWKTEL